MQHAQEARGNKQGIKATSKEGETERRKTNTAGQ